MTNKEIGEHVATVMRERGWSYEQMARYCGVMPYRVKYIVEGKPTPKEVIALVAIALGLDVPGLTTEGKRKRKPRKAGPNPMRDLVLANGRTWPELAAAAGLCHSGQLHGIGVTEPIPSRMLAAFEEFTGLSHKHLLELSLSLCRTAGGLTAYRNRYAAIYGRYPDERIAKLNTKTKSKAAEKAGPYIPATIAGIEQEMDRIREEVPADETPEQRAKRIEHLDTLWRARRDLRAKQVEKAV